SPERAARNGRLLSLVPSGRALVWVRNDSMPAWHHPLRGKDARAVALILDNALASRSPDLEEALRRVTTYPRLRFMGSKYRVMPQLLDIFGSFPFDSALDAFSGSGVVAYGLKAMGRKVAANDFLAFTAAVARATVENSAVLLEPADITAITGPAA